LATILESKFERALDFISVNTDAAMTGRAATGVLQRLRKA
jgi:hypothetical protein